VRAPGLAVRSLFPALFYLHRSITRPALQFAPSGQRSNKYVQLLATSSTRLDRSVPAVINLILVLYSKTKVAVIKRSTSVHMHYFRFKISDLVLSSYGCTYIDAFQCLDSGKD
jgi:hypothetical protein